MHWNDDARAAVAKAPFFVRGMITKRVEGHVRQQGRDTVTLTDVEQLRASHLGGMSSEQIEQMVRSSVPGLFADERTYEVKTCGFPGCPRSLFDVHALARKMVAIIEQAGVPEAVTGRVTGPVLRHDRLLVSISGCPNSCSQPQIADFGVQGRLRPAVGSDCCTGCGACVRVCRENAVTVSSNTPLLAPDLCIDCGDCVAACPTQALTTGSLGFTALIGGKLGRKPQLARTLFDFTGEPSLLTAFRVTCEIFTHELKRGERMANAVDRIGIDEIARRCTLTP